MSEYPKALYKGPNIDECLADRLIVHSVADEEIAREGGYQMYAEIYTRHVEAGQKQGDLDAAAFVEKRQYNRKAK